MIRSRVFAAALLLSAVGLSAVGCAGGADDSPRHLSSPVLDGVRDEVHTGVVAVYHASDTDPELCSGFVIGGDLVLTARHCVGPLDNPSGGCGEADAGDAAPTTPAEPWAATTLTVHLETAFGSAAKIVRVAEVHTLDGSTGKPICGSDVAVLRLAKPLDGITPYPLRVDAPPTAAETFSAIGYGASAGGPDTTSGIRRSRDGLHVSSVGVSTSTTDGEWIADTGPCAGDSGSPAIDARGFVIGVMSRGSKATCTSMIYERLDTHAAFLRAEVIASATRLGVDPPAWATGADAGPTEDVGLDATSTADAATTDATPDAATSTPESSSAGCAVGGSRSRSRSRSGAGVGHFAIAGILGLVIARRRRR